MICESTEILNLEEDKKYIKSEVISLQPNGLLCKYSNILKCVCCYNMSKDQYVRYWVSRYHRNAKDVEVIKQYCEDLLENHLTPIDKMIELVKKSKDRPSEKQKVLNLLTESTTDDNIYEDTEEEYDFEDNME